MCLKIIFSSIHSVGAAYGHPTPLNFMYHLKLYILGKHSKIVLSNKLNVEESETDNNVAEESVLTSMLMPYTKETIMDSNEEKELCVCDDYGINTCIYEDNIPTLNCTLQVVKRNN
jgi:hypothetical protein